MSAVYRIEIEHRDTDQVFSYYHGDRMLHFNATLLARLRAQMPDEFRRITMDLDERVYRLCTENRGIEEPKIAALRPRDLREPGYGVLFEDGTFSIIDGHHRLVRRYRGGVRVMDFWVTDRNIWEHCLVEYSAEGEAEIAKSIPAKIEKPEHIVSRVTIKKDDKP